MEGSDTCTVDPMGSNVRKHPEQNGKDHRKDRYADHVEQQMDHRCSLCRTVGADTGKKSSGTGTDIGSEADEDCCADTNCSAGGSQCLKDTYRRRRTLHDHCNDKTKGDTQERIRAKIANSSLKAGSAV